MLLRLTHLVESFPTSWRTLVPNAFVGYIEPVRRSLTEMGVFSGDDKRFSAISHISRYIHPRADEEALVLSLELMTWFFFFDDPFDDGLVQGTAGTALIERMLRVLMTGELPDSPTGTERLCRQFRERARRM